MHSHGGKIGLVKVAVVRLQYSPDFYDSMIQTSYYTRV
jgi:hypothetical protein